MSGRTPITPWSADTGVSGESLAAAPAVQALQPLIDGASMASSPELHSLFGALAEAQGAMQNAEKNQQAKVGQSGDADVRRPGRRARRCAGAARDRRSLAIVQLPLMDLSVAPPRLSVATVLGHSSGQWIGVRMDAEAPTLAGMNDLQALGNATAVPAPLRPVGDHRHGPAGHGRRREQRPARARSAPGAGRPEAARRDRRDARQAVARQSRGGRECVANARARCRNWRRCVISVKELAAAPAQPAQAPPQPAAAPTAPAPTQQEHTPERAAKINRLVSALDARPG